MPTKPTFIDLLQQQRSRDQNHLSLLAFGTLVIFVVSLCAGDSWIWPSQWLSDSAQLFVWQLRMPRALGVLAVGASLAVSGAVMQALFENPLAEPGLLGVANGAGVALVLTVLLGHGLLPVALMSLNAIIGALLITFLLLAFARRRVTNARLLLVGVALGIVCSAIMTWAVYISTSLDLRQLMYWMMGSFGGVDWRQKWLILALLPVLLWLCRQQAVEEGSDSFGKRICFRLSPSLRFLDSRPSLCCLRSLVAPLSILSSISPDEILSVRLKNGGGVKDD